MNIHDAVNKQAKACKLLKIAKEMSDSEPVVYLKLAEDLFNEVGDKYFGKAFQDELNRVYEDA